MTNQPSPAPIVPELLDVTKICTTFPSMLGIQIPRDNIHHTLETILGGDVELLSLEGPEGLGKTTVLAQFAKRHLNRCISMFVSPNSRFVYDPTIQSADLCNQMNWILHGEEVPTDRASDPSLYHQLVMKLQRGARRSAEPFYFIVDGLETLAKDSADVQGLLDLLPFGFQKFRFLFSGNAEQILKLTNRKILYKGVPIPGFTLDESTKFFADISTSTELITEFFKACKGVPAHLAAIKRIIQSGVPAESLLEKPPDTIRASFEIEWKAVDEHDDLQISVLTLISGERRKLSITDISQIFDTDVQAIRHALSSLGFMSLPTDDHSEVTFISEAFRKFALLRLQAHQDQVRAKVIDSLLKQPSCEDAMTYLPTFLEESGRLPELLKFLSPGYFAEMIGTNQSLAPVQQKAELGVNAAIRLDRDDDLLRFGLQEAVISELDGCEISRSEVSARMALDDYESSLALAQTAVLKQDRLRLIALIARLQKEKGLTPELALIEQIQKLYEEIDPHSLGDSLLELASDLMHSRPDLGLQLLERAPSSKGKRNSVDWALARISIELSSKKKNVGLSTSAAEALRSKIKDPALRRFSTSISFLVGNYSATEVLREIEKLDSVSDQLFLLQEWTEYTRHPEEAGRVAEHGLRLSIRSTEYTPHATHLRKLAEPLPYIPDENQRRSLIGTFDTQKGTIEKLGPTEDYVRLQISLTQAEAIHDQEAANTRLLEVFYYVNELSVLETRAACMARLVASVKSTDSPNTLRDSKDVLLTAERELSMAVDQLLLSTAQHDEVCKNIIHALASERADLAFKVVAAFNTQERRDAGYSSLFDEILRQRPGKIPLALLQKQLDSFVSKDKRDTALEELLERVSTFRTETIVTHLAELRPLLHRINKIEHLGTRYRAICSGLAILSEAKNDECAGLVAHLEKDLDETWQKMELGAEKIECGFRISSSLASYRRAIAQEYLNRADALRRRSAPDYNDQSCHKCIRLALRAYAGLLPQKFDNSLDLEKLVIQIERILSDQSRISLWTELALRCFQYDNFSVGKQLVTERIKPGLDAIRARSEGEWQTAVVESAPALYYNHKLSAIELF
jgi:hypothetical protein